MTRNIDNIEEAAEIAQAAINDIAPDSDDDGELDEQIERKLGRLNTTLTRTR